MKDPRWIRDWWTRTTEETNAILEAEDAAGVQDMLDAGLDPETAMPIEEPAGS